MFLLEERSIYKHWWKCVCVMMLLMLLFQKSEKMVTNFGWLFQLV